MNESELDREDVDLPERALEGLVAATRRAIAAGHARIVARDGQLLEIKGDEITVLRQIPPRKSVEVRTKFAKR